MTSTFNSHQSCLICGHPELRNMPQQYMHAHLVKCDSCGFVFSSRIPTEDELMAHYALYPRGTALSPLTVKRYEELLEEFELHRKTNRILDIGCGDAHFLKVAKNKGWEVYGTEYTDEAVAQGALHGISVFKGRIQDFRMSTDFDVITSFEVLEHINDITEHVSKINTLLRRGGLLYFTTPNFNAFSRRWLGGKWTVIEYPEHLCYFTAGTADRLLLKCGLQRKRILTTGFSVQRFKKSSGTNPGSDSGSGDEALRINAETKLFYRLARRTINSLLNLFKLGDTLKGYYVKP